MFPPVVVPGGVALHTCSLRKTNKIPLLPLHLLFKVSLTFDEGENGRSKWGNVLNWPVAKPLISNVLDYMEFLFDCCSAYRDTNT